mmetsp:Transcript_3030/g.8705  ORF Transcript_3030/g.8705 Transcript_3030/m.8705 type:complete len:875 (-) Transcript_3030:383-3007(-)
MQEDTGYGLPGLVTTQPESLLMYSSLVEPEARETHAPPSIDTAVRPLSGVDVQSVPVDVPASPPAVSGSLGGCTVSTTTHGPVQISPNLFRDCNALFLALQTSDRSPLQEPLVPRAAAQLLILRSSLSQQQTSEILEFCWSLDPSESPDWLSRGAWLVACKLVAHAQHSFIPATGGAAEEPSIPPIQFWAPAALEGGAEDSPPDFRVAFGASVPSTSPVPCLADKFPSAAAAAATSPSTALDIHVHRGEDVSEGQFSSFRTYTMTTRTTLPWLPSGHINVTRRYRDFEWLQERLRLVFPGLVLPAAPPKGLFRDENFLSEREEWLNLYMRSLAKHAHLHTSFELQVLLCSTPEGLSAAKSIMPAAGQSGASPRRGAATLAPEEAEAGGEGERRLSEGGGATGAAVAMLSDAAGAAGSLVQSYGLRPSVQVLQSLWGGVTRSIRLTTALPPLPATEDLEFSNLAAARAQRREAYGRFLQRMEALHSLKRERAKEANATALALEQVARFLQSTATQGSWSEGALDHKPTALSPPASPPTTTSPPATGGAAVASIDDREEDSQGRGSQRGGDQGADPGPRSSDLRQGMALDLLATAGQKFFKSRIRHLNNEFDAVIHLKFVKGVLDSEAATVASRDQALEDLRRAAAQVASASTRHQNALKDSRTQTARADAAEAQVSEAKALQRACEGRIEAISATYKAGVARCDAHRAEDMVEIMVDLCRAQQQQAADWNEAIQGVLHGLKPTDAEVTASRRRIRAPLPPVVLARIYEAQGRPPPADPRDRQGGVEERPAVVGASGGGEQPQEVPPDAAGAAAAVERPAPNGEGAAPGELSDGQWTGPPQQQQQLSQDGFGDVDLTSGGATSPGADAEDFADFIM